MPRRPRIVVSSSSEDEVLNTSIGKRSMPAKWDFDFEEDKTSKPKRQPKALKKNITVFSDPCVEEIIPFENLIVHKKKLMQLEEWFKGFRERYIKKESSILVVTGPTGSGKTASVQSLMSKLFIKCCDGYEFSTSKSKEKVIKSQFLPLKLTLYEEEEHDDMMQKLDTEQEDDGKVLIFDNLPHPDAAPILENLMACWDDLTHLQLILIFTDPCGPEHPNLRNFSSIYAKIVKIHPQITTTISFNPVAASLMKKLCSDQRKVELFGGDIRSMKMNKYFADLLPTEVDSLEHCDDSFDVFHLAGKILYPRGEEKAVINPYTVASPNRSFVQSLLYHNYHNFFHSPKSLSFLSDTFSLYESLDWKLREDAIWSSSFASLPEVAVSYAHNFECRSKEFKFTPIKSPPSLGTKCQKLANIWELKIQ